MPPHRASGLKNPAKTAPSKPKLNGTSQTASSINANKPLETPTYPLSNTASSSRIGKTDSTNSTGSPQDLQASVGEPLGVNGIAANGIEKSAPAVNRKKQKRRQKQAARLAAEQPSAAPSTSNQAYIDANANTYEKSEYPMSTKQARMAKFDANGYGYGPSEYDDPEYEPGEGEDLYYTDDDHRLLEKPFAAMRTNGFSNQQSFEKSDGNAKKKKKKTKSTAVSQTGFQSSYDAQGRIYSSINAAHQPPPPPPPPALSTAALRSAHHISKDRIWNTSTAEERERIKEFWLSLGEEDRRSLVKVEKEAVLKKMKEQQKHSCSCTVCGRKRIAIEEELEVLYDAYYEELEQYANHQHINLDDGTPMIPPPMMYGHSMGRMAPSRPIHDRNHEHPSRGRIHEIADDELDGDDEEDSYDEDDEDEEISDGEPDEPMGHAADFFNFGNSLTVQGVFQSHLVSGCDVLILNRRHFDRCR